MEYVGAFFEWNDFFVVEIAKADLTVFFYGFLLLSTSLLVILYGLLQLLKALAAVILCSLEYIFLRFCRFLCYYSLVLKLIRQVRKILNDLISKNIIFISDFIFILQTILLFFKIFLYLKNFSTIFAHILKDRIKLLIISLEWFL